MWARKQKKGNHMPLPALRPFFPWPKNCHFNKFGFISVIFKICKQILFDKPFILDFKNRKCINNIFLNFFLSLNNFRSTYNQKEVEWPDLPPAPPSHFKDL